MYKKMALIISIPLLIVFLYFSFKNHSKSANEFTKVNDVEIVHDKTPISPDDTYINQSITINENHTFKNKFVNSPDDNIGFNYVLAKKSFNTLNYNAEINFKLSKLEKMYLVILCNKKIMPISDDGFEKNFFELKPQQKLGTAKLNLSLFTKEKLNSCDISLIALTESDLQNYGSNFYLTTLSIVSTDLEAQVLKKTKENSSPSITHTAVKVKKNSPADDIIFFQDKHNNNIFSIKNAESLAINNDKKDLYFTLQFLSEMFTPLKDNITGLSKKDTLSFFRLEENKNTKMMILIEEPQLSQFETKYKYVAGQSNYPAQISLYIGK
ncbi:hypothetical protein [Listeria booriae]|uniref:hypothetical protein n=1 Tax=Listeria booriae TaxID=1552123 RepID=UPI0016268E90|nr:hypothetical protein [Listeria booriae]MBC2163779.1 hypothetical protein [Listeria booriae]